MNEPTEPPHLPRDRPLKAVSWLAEPEGDTALESNWLFTLRKRRYRSRESGRSHDFFVVELADAVNVIALTRDGRVLLVEQFRAGSGRDSLEPPGGLLDPGEDPLVAGVRELLEETGYAGDEPELINTVWSCPSLLTSRITTILVRNARRFSEPKYDEGEELRLELVPATRVPHLIRSGRIGHALSVQGLLWWLVSELPDTPFERPELVRKGAMQFKIGGSMVIVAIVAGLLALIRLLMRMPLVTGIPILFVAILFLSSLIVRRLVDPLPGTTLTRSLHRIGRRSILRSLATFGLAIILTFVCAVLMALTS